MADLLTVAEVARYLSLGSEQGEHNTTLGEMIDAAQKVIERVTHRTLDTNTRRTEYHDGAGTWLYADEAPITEIIALTDDAQYSARSIDLDNVVTTEDGGVNYKSGKVELWKAEGGFSGSRLGVRICYDAGWTATTLPADLRQAWIELVAFWFNNPERVGLVQAAQGGESIQWQQAEVPEELLRVFKSYYLAR